MHANDAADGDPWNSQLWIYESPPPTPPTPPPPTPIMSCICAKSNNGVYVSSSTNSRSFR